MLEWFRGWFGYPEGAGGVLTSGGSAWISLFIIFIGLQYAWKLTARREIALTGPYQAEAPQ